MSKEKKIVFPYQIGPRVNEEEYDFLLRKAERMAGKVSLPAAAAQCIRDCMNKEDDIENLVVAFEQQSKELKVIKKLLYKICIEQGIDTSDLLE